MEPGRCDPRRAAMTSRPDGGGVTGWLSNVVEAVHMGDALARTVAPVREHDRPRSQASVPLWAGETIPYSAQFSTGRSLLYVPFKG